MGFTWKSGSPDERFEIRPSTIPGGGLGLFAARDLAEGEELEVVGPRVLAGSIEDQCTNYADSHKFRFGDHLILPFGFAGMVNHSDAPNMVRLIQLDRVFLKTLRQVNRGEELFHQYVPRAKIYFNPVKPNKNEDEQISNSIQ